MHGGGGGGLLRKTTQHIPAAIKNFQGQKNLQVASDLFSLVFFAEVGVAVFSAVVLRELDYTSIIVYYSLLVRTDMLPIDNGRTGSIRS